MPTVYVGFRSWGGCNVLQDVMQSNIVSPFVGEVIDSQDCEINKIATIHAVQTEETEVVCNSKLVHPQ